MNFVVVDVDRPLSKAQRAITQRYYRGLIPHVVVTDRFGKTLYDDAGEVEESVIIKSLEKALAK